MENPYQPIKAKILKIIPETPNIKTFVLKPEDPLEFKAGQFIQLTVPGIGEAPFTPSSSPYEKEKIEVTVMKVGSVTLALHNLKEKDTIGIRGPYGKEYPLSDFEKKEILIVGGGVGLAPLRSLFLALTKNIERYKKVLFCYGAKTPDDIVCKEAVLKNWQSLYPEKIHFRITVDKTDGGWKGKVGLVTTTLDNLEEEIKDTEKSPVIVCGPPIMMKFTTFKLLELGYRPPNIFLSMEKNMSCGIGKCGHCQMGKYLLCRDGPVLTYDKIKDIPTMWD
jgi:NAD(P)H-flavin reductase